MVILGVRGGAVISRLIYHPPLTPLPQPQFCQITLNSAREQDPDLYCEAQGNDAMLGGGLPVELGRWLCGGPGFRRGLNHPDSLTFTAVPEA
ncbi:hypothetical protein JZ751_029146 [Albula glossodonta]|uniref:Uncharacterized protein n=1 Tax=Albula glossodonta TaxID=121402 RepID=A0A8T2P9A4_9TELE|nr:hypothetical protein JZ751_029146 [Albula glossodonta]